MDIEKCILSITKGSIDDLEMLYEAMRTDVYNFALSIACDASLAEDIVQDVFLQIYKKAALYKPGTNPKGWIMTITKHLAYDMLRKQSKIIYSELEAEDNLEVIGSEKSEVEKYELLDALTRLSPIERQIVILKAVSGFTHAEVAELLHIPEGTVKWRYHKALKELADEVGGGAYGT